jgi:hypothetical protein
MWAPGRGLLLMALLLAGMVAGCSATTTGSSAAGPAKYQGFIDVGGGVHF